MNNNERRKSKVLKKEAFGMLPFSADSVPLIWLPNEWDGKTHSIVK